MTISSRLLLADKFSKYTALSINEYSNGRFTSLVELKDFIMNKNTTKDDVIELFNTYKSVAERKFDMLGSGMVQDLKFIQSDIIS